MQLRVKSVGMSSVRGVSDLGESNVIKIYFILDKEALFRKMWKEVGIHQSSGTASP